jgi:hypothetical protein
VAIVTTRVAALIGDGSFPAGTDLLVWFVPDGAFAKSGLLFPERAVSAEPDGDGEISVNLTRTTDVLGDAYYRIRIEWFDTHPVTGRRVAGRGEVPGKLRVPAGGGDLSELLELPDLSGLFFVGYGPPPQWVTNSIYIDLASTPPGIYAPIGALIS